MDPSSNTLDNLVFTKSVVLSDVQAVRSVAFHPNGVGYAVGANTKVLRVFPSPNNSTFINFNSNYPEKQNSAKPPMKPLWAKKDVHKGSIYCVDWSLSGDLIATGSNDKMIKIIPVDPITQQLRGKLILKVRKPLITLVDVELLTEMDNAYGLRLPICLLIAALIFSAGYYCARIFFLLRQTFFRFTILPLFRHFA